MEILVVLLAWVLMGVVGRFLQSPQQQGKAESPDPAAEEDMPRWLADLTARLEEWADETDEDTSPHAGAPTAPPAVAPAGMTASAAHAATTKAPTVTMRTPCPDHRTTVEDTAAHPAALTVDAAPARRPLTPAEWRRAMVMATIFNPPRAEDPYRLPE